jgi:hypothetical protein
VLGVVCKKRAWRVIQKHSDAVIAASLIVLDSAAGRLRLYVGAHGLTFRRVLAAGGYGVLCVFAVIGAVPVSRAGDVLRIGVLRLVTGTRRLSHRLEHADVSFNIALVRGYWCRFFDAAKRVRAGLIQLRLQKPVRNGRR